MQNSMRVARKSFGSAFCATLCVLAVGVSPAVNALSYSFTDLGTGSFASAINDSGQVVGTFTTNGTHAALWNGTSLTDLGIGEARDINNAGQVVGNSNGQATLWNGTTRTDLGSFQAVAINNPGQVVGYTGIGPNAVLWNGTTATYMEPEGISIMTVTDINDAGQVVGWGRTIGTGPNQARLLNGTSAIRLNSLPGADLPDSSGSDINNRGQIVGYTHTSHELHAVIWNGTTTPTDLGTLVGGTVSMAAAINDRGQIVGYSNTETWTDSRAILWEWGSIVDLNSFLDASTIADGWVLRSATDINESGWIVGQAFNTITGANDAFLLSVISPAPEPEIYAMMLTGLGVLGWAGRRKKLKECTSAQ